jgi:hypothetical protein
MSFQKHSSRFVKQARQYRVTPEISSGFISEFLETLDCPRSLAVDILFRNGEHEQLANLEFNPLDYLKIEEIRDAYAATKFLSKFKDLILDYDLDDVAMHKFDKFESMCKQTNARFRKLELDPIYRGPVVALHYAVQRKISRILGEFDIREFFEMADWGPGATTLLKARDASATNKFQCETGITRDLYTLLPSDLFKEVYPLWGDHILGVGFPNFQVGNRVVTVPKDATANRVIAIEPGINLWFQKAIGSMIQKRLQRCGIDLRHQSINQSLAYLASKDAKLATIDFSSASDSISSEVIRELFENCSYSERNSNNLSTWYSVLDSCRSHYGLRDGTWVKWDKFSSMGNGFTFQLESLLFYAIAKSCVEYIQRSVPNAGSDTVSVYGDDVIIPCNCLEIFSVMCGFYGFTINMKKSHFSSFFRESCGSHFIMGADAKPVYLKGHLSDVLSVYRMANSVRRFAHRRLNKMGCDARFRSLFDRLVNLVPKPLRARIPETLGDGGFISNWDEATPVRARHCIEGYFVYSATEVGKTYQSEGVGLLLDRLWSARAARSDKSIEEESSFGKNASEQSLIASSQEKRNTVSLRGRTSLRFSRSLVQQWYDLGGWF